MKKIKVLRGSVPAMLNVYVDDGVLCCSMLGFEPADAFDPGDETLIEITPLCCSSRVFTTATELANARNGD